MKNKIISTGIINAVMLIIAFTHLSSEAKAEPSSVKKETVTIIVELDKYATYWVFSNDPKRSEFNGCQIGMFGKANQHPQSLMEKCWPELVKVLSNDLSITKAMYKAGYVLKSAAMNEQRQILIFEK